MNLFRKSLAALLVLTTVAQTAIPAFSAATYSKDNGTFVLTDADGNQTIVDESWEETYPTGTFAFSAEQVNLVEGATDGTQTGTITLYRLGGTEGRAEAYVTLVPAVTQLDEETKGYANAAGTKDYLVTVENPQPIAFYQPLGIPGDVVRTSNYAIDTDMSKADKDAGEYPYYIVGLDKADAYQWQVLSGGEWQDVKDATEALFYVTDEYYWSFDGVRCIFTKNGVRYCTLSDGGDVYEDGIEEEELPPIPEGFVNSMEKTAYDVVFDGNEYDMYTIGVIFAEGEWEKTITFTALDDDLHENTEVVALQITEAKGAVLYDSAMIATVAIADDESVLPSQIGFATDVVYANKADGSVQIPLVRADGTQYVVGAQYRIDGNTAIVGKDYAAADGESVTYFPADMTTTALEVELIDDGVTLSKDDTGVYFTVTLTGVQGADGSGIMTGKETCKVYLYNTSVEKPENGNIATELYAADETDAGADVLTTPALATLQDTIVAKAVEKTAVDVVADFDPLFSTESVNGRAVDYGKLQVTIPKEQITNYWKDYSMIANTGLRENYKTEDNTAADALVALVKDFSDTYDGYMTDASLWTFDPNKNNDRGDGWEYSTQQKGSMELLLEEKIGDAMGKFVGDTPEAETIKVNDIYSKLELMAEIKVDTNTTSIYSTVDANFCGPGAHHTAVSKGTKKVEIKHYTFEGDALKPVKKINFWTEHHGSGDFDAESWVHLDYGYLQRRTMAMPYVVLHTADDEVIMDPTKTSDYVREKMIEKIRPTVKLLAGQSGVTGNADENYNDSTKNTKDLVGKQIYVGSAVKVERNSSATSSYTFFNGSNGSAVTFSERKNGNAAVDDPEIFTGSVGTVYTTGTLHTNGKKSEDYYTLHLAKGADTSDNTQINVYLNREQEIVLDISPSVQRVAEGSPAIDPSKVNDAWKLVWGWETVKTQDTEDKMLEGTELADYLSTLTLSESRLTNATVTYKYYDSGTKTFKTTTQMWKQRDFSNPDSDGVSNVISTSLAGINNITSINFHLDPEDYIVFDGKIYAGDADIEIPAHLFTEKKLNFYYYSKRFLSVDSTMKATITSIERIIDADGDNVADANDPMLPAITGDTYTITELSPVKLADADKYSQMILRVSYTLLPRNLFAPDAASANAMAEVIPGLVNTLANKNGLSKEQQGYRYLQRGAFEDVVDDDLTEDQKKAIEEEKARSSGFVPVYGASAAGYRYIDIPLGGDTSPATYDAATDSIIWNPTWTGNSYYDDQFPEPEPIYLDGTPLGDRYPVGEVDGEGKLTGVNAVQQYLVGIHENDTIALCVREADIKGTDGSIPVYNADNEDDPTGQSAALENAKANMGKDVDRMESITHASFTTYPDSTSARDLVDPNANSNKDADFDSSGAGAPMPEYNMAGQQTMPNLDISLGDYVTIATNGQELSFTIGMPLMSYENQRTGQDDRYAKEWEDASVNGVKDSNEDAIKAVKSIFNTLKSKATGEENKSDSPAKMIKNSMSDYMDQLKREQVDAQTSGRHNHRGNYGIKFLGVEGSLALSISIVVKWDPIDASFHFNQMLIVLAGSIQFSYTAHLTPCPIVYVSVTVGFEAELTLGLEAVRKKVVSHEYKPSDEDEPFVFEVATDGSKLAFDDYLDNWEYKKSSKLGGSKANEVEDGDVYVGMPGATFTVTTKKKAIDIHFNGTLYVDAVAADGSKKVPEGFVAGTINADGEDGEEATIKLAKSVDGKDNDIAYTVTFTVIDDGGQRVLQDGSKDPEKLNPGYAVVDRILVISKNTTDVKFSGVNISPSLFMELAIGVGVELFKVELFANISVSCAFAILATDDGTYAGDKNEFQAFQFNEFSMAAALGFRVTALFFNFEFEAVKFMITYDREAKYDEQASNKSGWNFFWYVANKQMGGGQIGKARTVEDEDSPLTIRVILPGEEGNESRLFSPEDNMLSDKERAYTPTDASVPFEYTASFSAGDAFTLGEDMASGSDYALLTVGDTNYIVYTYTDGESIHASQLAISKVQETVDAAENKFFGLSAPIGTGNYYKLDKDTYGDLDFDAWVVDENTIRVAWVSYTEGATAAYNAKLNANKSIEAMADAGKHTQVKTVTLTIGADGTMTAGAVEVASSNDDGHGLYYMVSGAGDMVFYNEANYYTEEELQSYLTASRANLGASPKSTADESGKVVKYGTSDPTTDFQMQYRELNARLYGKTGYPTYALRQADGSYTITSMQSEEWIADGVQLENTAMTKVGNLYYAAFTTVYSKITADDEMTYRKLYLQRLTPGSGEEAATLTVGDPVVLRSLVESDKNSEAQDGVYVNGVRSVAYEDPYFANLNFLTGKLGELTGEPDDFYEILSLRPHTKAGRAAAQSTFLLFEMNGETLVVPENSLKTITNASAGSKRTGAIIPFFHKESAQELNEANKDTGNADVKSAPVLSNVTFGTDREGNIVAVYTRSVRGTANNALYLSKYDPDAQTWGNGVMLAMRDMTTYEDAVRNDWTTEELQAAFNQKYATAIDNNTEAAVFNFEKVSIGLASSTADDDRILVITEGTKSLLQKTAAVVPVYKITEGTDEETGEKIDVIAVDENGMPVVEKLTDDLETIPEAFRNESSAVALTNNYETALDENGVYNTQKGIYALTFGAGQQALGYTSISLTNYNFAPGAAMEASVSFTNTGDTTLRGSVNEPLQIDLCLAGAPGTSIATWKVTESVAVGQEVETELTQITIPASMEVATLADSYMYFTVQETGTSEEPFSADTIAWKDGKVVSDPACILIGEKIELALERCEISVVDADDKYVTLSLDALVTNRGAVTADEVQVTFAYTEEKTTGIVETPLGNYKNSDKTLKASAAEKIDTSTGKKARDGQAPLVLSVGSLPPMHQSYLTGTFVVPKDHFDANSDTGSLNLVLQVKGKAVETGDETEHTQLNNTAEVSVEPKTMIAAPAMLAMQVGSMMRIPVVIKTTAETAPEIEVIERPAESGKENCMSVAYFTKANNEEDSSYGYGTLVLLAGSEGETKVCIQDPATNDFYDICIRVQNEGTFTNIAKKDTEFFTWMVTEDGELVEEKKDDPKWKDTDAYNFPGNGELQGTPYNKDLAVAHTGYAFSFQTYATSLDLYFMGVMNDPDLAGKIEVSSTLPGFTAVTLTSYDATRSLTKTEDAAIRGDKGTGQKVDFQNTYNKLHTVTVKVLSDSDTVETVYFDKLLEHFNENLVVTSGKAAPMFTFSRDLPEMGSVPADEELPLDLYFLDDLQLVDAWIDGKSVLTDETLKAYLTQIDGDTLWKLTLDKLWKVNGPHTIKVTNSSGNYAEQDIEVDWFSTTTVDPDKKDPMPGQITAQFVNASGGAITKAELGEIYIQLQDGDGEPIVDDGTHITVRYLETVADQDGVIQEQFLQSYPLPKPIDTTKANVGRYKLPGTGGSSVPASGVYCVTYTDPTTGIASSVLLTLAEGETSVPTASIKVDKDGKITVTANKTRRSDSDTYIEKVTVNGVTVADGLAAALTTNYTKTLDPAIAHNGVFTVEVTDGDGVTATAAITVKQYPMTVDDDKVLTVEPAKDYTDGKLNENGTVTVNVAEYIHHGTYDDDYSTDADGNIGWTDLAAKYQVAIVDNAELSEDTSAADISAAELDWVTLGKNADSYTFDTLAVGTYTIYLRDANAPDKVFEYTVVIKQYNVEIVKVEFKPSQDEEGGSITITAIGGMGELEYRLVDENGEPFVDKNGNVLYGWQKENTFTNLPNAVYKIEVRDTANYDNVVTPNVDSETVTVDKWYSVRVTSNAGGRVEIDGEPIVQQVIDQTYYFLEGSRIEITAIPNQGNRTAKLRVNQYLSKEASTYVIESIDQSYEVEVDFGMDYSGIEQALTYHETEGKYKVKHTITATAGEGGSITPEGNTIVYYGDELTYTMTPDEGYAIASVLVDGQRVPITDTYTFTETSRNRRIHVTFKKIDG